MQNENNPVATMNDCEIVSTRIFNASPQALFNAWQDPQLLKQWWGPNGFTNTFHQFNFEPKGCWDFTMHAPDGTDYYNEIVFQEIIQFSRIVFKHIEPHHTFTGTIILEPMEDKTHYTFSMVFESATECENVKAIIIPANEENFDRLANVLAK